MIVDVDTTEPGGPAADEAVQQAPGERGMVSPADGARDGRVGVHGGAGAPDADTEPRADASTAGVEPEAPLKRKAKRVSPTARSLAELRKRGWPAQVVEQTIPRTFIKRDLFGCIDIIALTPEGILGIQATSNLTGGNHSERRRKIDAEPRAQQWLAAGGKLEIWSWSKRGGRGERKLWTLRVEAVTPTVEDPTT